MLGWGQWGPRGPCNRVRAGGERERENVEPKSHLGGRRDRTR